MKFSILFFIAVFLFLFSCKEKNKNTIESKNIEEQVEVKIISKAKIVALNPKAKQTVENWNEYHNINDFIPQYYHTTTKESLFNSQRLAELTQQLKDTIRVDKFDIPSFRIRLNVLNNVALRLADMDSIPSITNKEIIQENKNIVNAFNAVNDKINFIVNKEKLELDLQEFDHLFQKKDSLKKLDKKKSSNKQKRKRNIKRKRIQPLKQNE